MMKTEKLQRIIVLMVLVGFFDGAVSAREQITSLVRSYHDETAEEQAERTQWWNDCKFGMFIVFGPYSLSGGWHKGETSDRNAEWVMHSLEIPVDEYRETYAENLNPVKYDPDKWMSAAADAGMKYIMVTTKHHDGFAMFDSKVDDFDIVDATPYGKDVIGPLLEAARRHGIAPGIYYSQCLDWSHPGGERWNKEVWDPAQKGDFMTYVKTVAVPQMTELLTNYGDIDVLWWDMPMGMTPKAENLFKELVKLQPKMVTNNRLPAKHNRGDYVTPEGAVPVPGFYDEDYSWETCYNMHNSWGFRKGLKPEDWKSPEHLLETLVKIVSRGGNLLLNVGPTPEGELQPEELERLAYIGKWMRVNDEAIYGTTRSPLRSVPGGYATYKAKDNALYLLLRDWPQQGAISVPGLRNKVVSATLLADGTELRVAQGADGWSELHGAPAEAPDAAVSVVKLIIDGEPDVDPLFPKPDKKGVISLATRDLGLRLHGYRKPIIREKDHLSNWSACEAHVIFEVETEKVGWYRVVIDTIIQGSKVPVLTVREGQDGGRILDKYGSKMVVQGVENSGEWQEVQFEPIELKKGYQRLHLKKPRIPKGATDATLSIRNLRLVPSEPGQKYTANTQDKSRDVRKGSQRSEKNKAVKSQEERRRKKTRRKGVSE